MCNPPRLSACEHAHPRSVRLGWGSRAASLHSPRRCQCCWSLDHVFFFFFYCIALHCIVLYCIVLDHIYISVKDSLAPGSARD